MMEFNDPRNVQFILEQHGLELHGSTYVQFFLI